MEDVVTQLYALYALYVRVTTKAVLVRLSTTKHTALTDRCG